jgi:hypothetical protein
MNSKNNILSNMTPKTLLVGGVALIILGIGIIEIHNPLRGSGLGTISVIAGVAALAIAWLKSTGKMK